MVNKFQSLADNITGKKPDSLQNNLAADTSPYKPITPLGGSIQGQGPDQAKMIGTPSDKLGRSNALAEAAAQGEAAANVPQDDSLLTRLQELSFEGTTSPSAERAKTFTANLASFGSLGSRVEAKVLEAMSGTTDAEGKYNLVTDAIKVVFDNMPAGVTDSAAFEAGMSEIPGLLKSGGVAAATAKIVSIVNTTFDADNKSAATIELLNGIFATDIPSLNTAIANGVAGNVINPDDLTLGLLLGYDSNGIEQSGASGIVTFADLGLNKETIEEFVGPDWYKKTPEDIEKIIETKRVAEMTNITKIRRMLADPNVGDNVKAGLRDELRAAGASGMLQAEEEAKSKMNAIEAASKIVVEGQVVDIKELLKNDKIRARVDEYLSKTPEEKLAWKDENEDPLMTGLTDWLDAEAVGAANSAKEMDTLLEDLETTVHENKVKMDEAFGKGFSSPEALKLLGFDPDNISSSTVEGNELYKAISTMESGQITEVANFFTSISSEAMFELGEMDPTKLQELMTNKPKRDKFRTVVALLSDSESFTYEKLQSEVFIGHPNLSTPAGINSTIDDLELQFMLYGDAAVKAELDNMNSIFDANGDGNIDSAAEIANNMKGMIGGDLSDISGLETLDSFTDSFTKVLNETDEISQFEGNQYSKDAYNALTAALGDDGKISVAEFDSFPSDNLDQGRASLALLYKMKKHPGKFGDKQLIEDRITTIKDDQTKHHLNTLPAYGDKIKEIFENDDNSYGGDLGLREEIWELEEQLMNKIADKSISWSEKQGLKEELKRIRTKTSGARLSWEGVITASRNLFNRQFESKTQVKKMLGLSDIDWGKIAPHMYQTANGKWVISGDLWGGRTWKDDNGIWAAAIQDNPFMHIIANSYSSSEAKETWRSQQGYVVAKGYM